ncbi:MBL fold metallo-hydrolase RNA specificity domain-containing protein [Spirillospora sp. NPDC048911]|uniref:MBL fold metallo-hydrolase RNA specificity domain-containing protein n=1 Tax=Spirillospora sp. NPDC048911 TaxID=3364527 RepID=UPI00372172E2
MSTLTFLGATGAVTGSKFLFGDVLLDCGLYQGAMRRENWRPLGVPVDAMSAVVLSHAHLDHCGYLPVLVRDGFRGPVYATAHTSELAAIVLRDSAKLLADEARLANRQGWSKHRPALPLYTEDDVARALARIVPIEVGDTEALQGGGSLHLHHAGHILGSAWTEVTAPDGRRIVHSGDLGRPGHPLLRPPEPFEGADALLVESTYGDGRHDDETGERVFAEAITRTLDRGGSVVIPAFAVDRTEVVLFHLNRMRRAGQLPQVPIYVDSPMALAAREVYLKAISEGAPELREGLGPEVLIPEPLYELHTADESCLVNRPGVPSIIISASGMATGGRVLHHLAALLPDPRTTVLIVGFAAVGTRARSLVEGARSVKIHGRYVPVRAEVVNVPGFSVHADADEIIGWLRQATEPPATTYVVHGETGSSARLRDRIIDELGWHAVVPRLGERVLV